MKVSTTSSLSVSRPAAIIEGAYLASATLGTSAYAVSPDGRFFYLIESKPEPAVPRRIHVVLGWLEEFASAQKGS